MLVQSLLSSLAFATVLNAAAISKLVPDQPYTTPTATLQAAITCPNGIKGAKGGIVYLIHGTGSTGAESWGSGPYVEVLPTAGQGYDVCYVDLPNRSMTDAQISAEYVAYGIQYLAPQSKTKKVAVIGHSQGAGLNIPWALIFWPSTQHLVSNTIFLAGDLHGTDEGIFLCNPLSADFEGCQPSLWQQTVGSQYLAAQNSMLQGGGGQALTPTTSIFTRYDEVIQSEQEPSPTSFLTGANVHALQDLDYCGPAHFAEHFLMVVDTAAFGLVKATLEAGKPVPISSFNKEYCTYLVDDTLFNPGNTVPFLTAIVNDVVTIGVAPRQMAEPPLKKYVCDRGFAPVGTCGST